MTPKQCATCGKSFTPSKHAPRKLYCNRSPCTRSREALRQREYWKLRREVRADRGALA